MVSAKLDAVDRGVLHLLQRDARDTTTTQIAERVGVSSTTVSTRIQRLEEIGVIRGYFPDVDYESAGFPFRLFFVCTAPGTKRKTCAQRALDVPGVVSVRELLCGTQNVHVEGIGGDTDDVERIEERLGAIGLDVVNSELLKAWHRRPYTGFEAGLEDR